MICIAIRLSIVGDKKHILKNWKFQEGRRTCTETANIQGIKW